MDVMIFNDAQNFNSSLDFINNRYSKNKKRFWDYQKYVPFLLEKLKSLDGFEKVDFKLKKVFFYEGKYNSNLISSVNWNCNKKIGEINAMIKEEQRLLGNVSNEKISLELRRKINKHIKKVKENLEEKRQGYYSYKAKQKRNYVGQKILLEKLETNPLIDVKTTPLKQFEGKVYQKGVDVLLASDLINLAHMEAYDLAIILSGDTDFIKAVKLIKSLGKIPVIVSYYSPKHVNHRMISDLRHSGKFINLQELKNEEIFAMSELRENKNS
jgi:uncharacterized LabA/DUF88 family protein